MATKTPLTTEELKKALSAYQSGLGSDFDSLINLGSGSEDEDFVTFDDEPLKDSFGTKAADFVNRPLNP